MKEMAKHIQNMNYLCGNNATSVRVKHSEDPAQKSSTFRGTWKSCLHVSFFSMNIDSYYQFVLSLY